MVRQHVLFVGLTLRPPPNPSIIFTRTVLPQSQYACTGERMNIPTV